MQNATKFQTYPCPRDITPPSDVSDVSDVGDVSSVRVPDRRTLRKQELHSLCTAKRGDGRVRVGEPPTRLDLLVFAADPRPSPCGGWGGGNGLGV